MELCGTLSELYQRLLIEVSFQNTIHSILILQDKKAGLQIVSFQTPISFKPGTGWRYFWKNIQYVCTGKLYRNRKPDTSIWLE